MDVVSKYNLWIFALDILYILFYSMIIRVILHFKQEL